MVFLTSERTGGNIMKKEIETKICSCCGKELKLNKFIKNRRLCKVGFRKEYKTSYQSVCKDCRNEKRQNTLKEKGMGLYDNGKLVQIRRKYKKINPNRFLKQTESKLEYLDKHERFVKLLYYDNTWISNYGRPVIKKEDGTYEFVKGKRNKITKEIEYSLRKNIYIKTKKAWGYKQERVSASSLVIQTFIVNYDMKNNTMCWHKDNNIDNNFYKDIYPVTDKQYAAIKEIYDREGTVSEEKILEIVNDIQYKPDGWNPWYWRRSFEGVGYIGDKIDWKKEKAIYRAWANIIQKCYSPKVHKTRPYYKECTVSEEWKNFQNFKIWYKDYKGKVKQDLDKDILFQGNKEYSPETCVYTTHFINTVFEDRGSKKLEETKEGKYKIFMMIMGEERDLGVFDTKEECYEAFEKRKKEFIIKLAEKTKKKDKIPECQYQAMINWEVKAKE